MKPKDLFRTICGLLAGAMLFSCSKDAAEPTGEDHTPVRFSIDTRAADINAGTTFRIMAYNSDENTNRYKFSQTGTYYLQNENDEALTACKVDNTGNFESVDEAAGLNGTSGNYLLVFVSPGVENNADGSFSFIPTKNGFKATTPESRSIGGYGLITIKNKLQDRRASIGIDFYKSSSEVINDFTISDLSISGAGSDGGTVKIFPSSRQVEIDEEETIAITLTDADKTVPDGKSDPRYYFTAEANRVYIASAIYAPKAEVGKVLNTRYTEQLRESDYLYLNCKLKQGERKEVSIRMPLMARAPELLPQHHYTFNITVRSNYLSATVDVYDMNSNEWENGGSEGGTISKPDYTVRLGTWKIVGSGDKWELVEIDDQIIGGE